jgi:hypothetical protein
MADIKENAKAMATSTLPREFDISYSTTLEEVYEKLNARAAAFQMPFEIKGGIAGQRIAFVKEPDLDIAIWLYVKDGSHIKIVPNLQQSQTSVNGIRVDKNSVLRRGVKGAYVDIHVERGAYADKVTDTVKKILNGEEVEDYVAPVSAAPEAGDGVSNRSWKTTFWLSFFLGYLGVHRYYVGKIGTGILYNLTFGLFGIGSLVDFIKICCGKFTDKQGNVIVKKKKQ